MTDTAISITEIETTEIEISDNTVELSDTQVAYVNRGIAKGLADMEAGRSMSDPAEIEQSIRNLIDEKIRARKAASK